MVVWALRASYRFLHGGSVNILRIQGTGVFGRSPSLINAIAKSKDASQDLGDRMTAGHGRVYLVLVDAQ